MVARAMFTVATQIQTVILGWQMYTITKNPLYLGFIGLAEAVPALGLALHAGALVDRGSAETIYRRVLELSLVSAVVLLLSQIPSLQLSETVLLGLPGSAWALFFSAFLSGVARSFSQPSIYAIVPRIVPREHLSQASAWMAAWLQLARISGPALGGVLFAFVGITGAGVAVCLALVAAIGASLTPSGENFTPAPRKADTSRMKELFVGAVFVFKHPILLPALSLDMISVLFGGVTALLPIYAAEILFVGPQGLGALRAAPALGAAVMGYALTSLDIRRLAGPWLISAVIGFGISTLVFSISDSFWLSLSALALSGAFDSISVIIRGAIMQLYVPDDMRGRVSSINTIFIGSSNEIGAFESGVAARFLGLAPSVVFGGLATLTVVLIAQWKAKALKSMKFN
jgi:MFS family permease